MADAAAAPPPPAPSREEVMLAALKEVEAKEAGNSPTSEAAKPPEPPPAPKAESPKAPEPPKAEEEPMLTKIARQQAALRAERQQVEPYINALKVLPPAQVQALTKALQSRDPVSALASLGFSHAEYTNRLLDGATPGKPAQAAPKAEPAKFELPEEVKSELSELREFARSYRAEQERKQQDQAVEAAKAILSKKAEKFPLLNNLEDYQGVVNTILRFTQESGRPPGDTWEESVTIAAEYMEKQKAAEAERWRKVLQPVQPTGNVVPSQKAPVTEPSTGTDTPRTLSNGLASTPAAARPQPVTRDEQIQALLSDPNFLATFQD